MRDIVVFNTKGGVGKTTVACGLMTALRASGFDAAACDADPQGSLTAWFELRDRRGLAEVLSGTLDASFATIRPDRGVAVTPTGNRETLKQLTTRRVGEIPPYARDLRCDPLIVDTAAGINALTDSFLRWREAAILVPIPVAGGFLPMAAIDQVEDHLLNHYGRLPDFIVPNMLDRRTSATGLILKQLEARYPERLTPPIRINAALVHAAGNHVAPNDARAAQDFGELATYLIDALAD